MTPDERALLERFLQDLTQTRGVAKDRDAEAMILDAMRGSPDAPYVLVQHAILSDQALHAAQDEIASLRQQLATTSPSAQPPARFLGGPSPWSQAAAPQPDPQWQTPPQPQARPYVGSGPFSTGGGLGSFLRGAGTTAAGVAGGALLFEGLSGLFGGHRGFGGFGGFGGGGPTEVVNNYYEDNGPGGDFGGGGDSGGGWDDGGSSDF